MLRDLLQPLIEFYDTREEREQMLLLFGSPIMLILLFYLAVWDPILLSNEQLKNKLRNEQRFTQWFNQQSGSLSQNSAQFDWSKNNLPSIVERTLTEQRLTPWKKRIFQNQRQETVISFTDIPYSQLINWIQTLHAKYQVVFRNVNINATKALGKVDAKLTLATTHAPATTKSPFK